MTPSPWTGAVLAFAVYRLVRLVGWDDFPPIMRLRETLTGQQQRGDTYHWDRPLLAHFLACPFCTGFWASTATYIAWIYEPRWTIYLAVPLALSAAVGLISKNWDA